MVNFAFLQNNNVIITAINMSVITNMAIIETVIIYILTLSELEGDALVVGDQVVMNVLLLGLVVDDTVVLPVEVVEIAVDVAVAVMKHKVASYIATG